MAKLSTVPFPRPLLLCSYRCRTDSSERYWREMTILALTNPFSLVSSARADLFFHDGNGKILGCGSTELSLGDSDAVHLCETLDRELPEGAPATGLLTILLEPPEETDFGAWTDWVLPGAWMKDFQGSFRRGRLLSASQQFAAAEPASGTVSSMGKSACQLVWRNTLIDDCGPSLPLVLIEQSQDEGDP